MLKSKKRQELLVLLQKPRTPTFLAKETKSSLANVSLKLADLTKAGLVECLNPKDRKGRIYQLTGHGRVVLEKIEEMGKTNK